MPTLTSFNLLLCISVDCWGECAIFDRHTIKILLYSLSIMSEAVVFLFPSSKVNRPPSLSHRLFHAFFRSSPHSLSLLMCRLTSVSTHIGRIEDFIIVHLCFSYSSFLEAVSSLYLFRSPFLSNYLSVSVSLALSQSWQCFLWNSLLCR